jgi:hypothetical protein
MAANISKMLSTPTIRVNDQTTMIVPNSLTFTEGLGERSLKAQSGGGNQVGFVMSENIETRYSEVKFQLYATSENIEAVRTWKSNVFSNTLSFEDEGITRFGTTAGITNNYEVKTGESGTIDVEFRCNTLV